MKASNHANIPLFVPHMGCPHSCVFCDQKSISGRNSFDMENARKTIETALGTLRGRKAELAFFGGSFTAIDRSLMTKLLETAKHYKDEGALCGIRLSTRPDCVGEEILDILEKYGVTAIELGVQSMDSEVLLKSGRGHTVYDTEDAFFRIGKRKTFSLCGQMMLGLPFSTEEKETMTAKKICEMGADSCRIYPTAVLENTALASLYRNGEYMPLTLEEGVKRGAACYEIFIKNNVKILRMGLCAEESCEGSVIAGCYHPAYGELVRSRAYLEKIRSIFETTPPEGGKTYRIYVAKGMLSSAIGQKKRNREIITEEYKCRPVFIESERLSKTEVVIEEGE